jgi:hypothetical protein
MSSDADRLERARVEVKRYDTPRLVREFRDWCGACSSDRSIAYTQAIQDELLGRIMILQNIAESVGLAPPPCG